MDPVNRVFRLSGSCNNYPWGCEGQHSRAARMCAKTDKNFRIKDDERYSELWLGDYPDYPARVLQTGDLLKDTLEKHKDVLLGSRSIAKFGSQLPFLPKVLSIAKALPLQLHPDKTLAAKLHATDSSSFKDSNHKPEIAVALTRFEVFAGFKPLLSIEPLFKLSALQPFAPTDTTWTDDTLLSVVRHILDAKPETIKAVGSALLETPSEELGSASYIRELLPRLHEQYGPDDPGSIVATVCMNFLVLEPGEAIYIPADGIHAYLSGDIIECMARSDNVLNVGFCPQEQRNDVDLFVDHVVTEGMHSAEDVRLPAGPWEGSRNAKTRVFRPPLEEFDMLWAKLGSGEEDVIAAAEGPGVMIVTEGSGVMWADGMSFEVEDGHAYFVGPGVEVKWKAENGLEIFMAVA